MECSRFPELEDTGRARCVRELTNHGPNFAVFWEFGSFRLKMIPAHADHCRRCCTNITITRSFRGINSNKNGTFPSLSIVSSIVYITLVDPVNPGFEIFRQKSYLLYRRKSRRAPGASSMHPGSRPNKWRTSGSLRVCACTGVWFARSAPGPPLIHRLSTGYSQGSLGSLRGFQEIITSVPTL